MLIFIDTLRERDFHVIALTHLLFSPYIALLAFVFSLAITLSSGFQLGFISQLRTLPFGITYMTHSPREFFNQGDPVLRLILDCFSALGFGLVCSYCIMLLLPMETYLANLNFVDSVHNERNTHQSADRAAALISRYGLRLDIEHQVINTSIQQFLQGRVVQAPLRSLEKRYSEAALRCYHRL